jgi:hypothetical protein
MKAEKRSWQPPEFVSREQCIKDTEEVLGMPDISIRQTEDVFRINVLGMDWDLGMVVYEPEDQKKIPVGADGKKAGFFLLHGGSGDFKGIEGHSKLLASKFGFKVMAGTFREDSTFPTPAAIGQVIPFIPMGRCERPYGSNAKRSHSTSTTLSKMHLCATAMARARLPAQSRIRIFIIAWRPGRQLSKRE